MSIGDKKGSTKIKPSKKLLIFFVVPVLGLLIGFLGASNPMVSISQEQSTLLTPVSVGANSFASQTISLTKSETISFAMTLDNQTTFRLYIMNNSQYQTYSACAPKCMQPLLGGKGSYYQQAGATRAIVFLNESVSEFTPFSGNFTAPATDTYHFVFDNSVGKNWSEYLGQNATGFALGSLETVTFLVASNYSINWRIVGLGTIEILVGGIIMSAFWVPRVKLRKRRTTLLNGKFGTIILVGVVIAVLLLDIPVFLSGATNSNYFLPYGSGTKNQTSTVTTSPPSNYSIFEVDSDYLTNAAKDGFGQMSIDGSDQLVFIATKQANDIYVYNLPIEAETDIGGFNNPQSVLYVPQFGGKLFVSNGGNGTVDIFLVNGTGYPTALQRITEINFSSFTDSFAYDQSSGLVYVGFGNGSQSGIGVIDANTDTILGTIPLSAHPGQFTLEENGTRLYVNMPESNAIDVVDLVTRTVIDSWPTGNSSGNIGIALDEADNRLFVGYSNPPSVGIYDDVSGDLESMLKLQSSPGNVIYDPQSKLVLASCSNGTLVDFIQVTPNSYVLDSSQETGPLGSNSILFPSIEEVYVVVPQSGFQSAQIITFEIYQS